MSRMAVFFLICLCLLSYSCDENSNPIIQDYIPLIIQGRISNYNSDFKTVYASTVVDTLSIRIAESDISSDGEFYIEFPEHQSNYFMNHKLLNQIQLINSDSIIFIDNISIKNDVKFIKYSLFGEAMTSGPKGNINYAISLDDIKISDTNDLAQVGDYYLLYYYFAEATEITGDRKVRIVTSEKTKEYVTNYNVKINNGWNILEVTFESQTEDEIIYRVANQTKISGDWVIGGISKFSNFIQIL